MDRLVLIELHQNWEWKLIKCFQKQQQISFKNKPICRNYLGLKENELLFYMIQVLDLNDREIHRFKLNKGINRFGSDFK